MAGRSIFVKLFSYLDTSYQQYFYTIGGFQVVAFQAVALGSEGRSGPDWRYSGLHAARAGRPTFLTFEDIGSASIPSEMHTKRCFRQSKIILSDPIHYSA